MAGLIYLAHPIDQAQAAEDTVNYWAVVAKQSATEQGHGLYLPTSAFHLDGGAEQIQRAQDQGWIDSVNKINHRALALCGGVLALLPNGVPTIGTPIEIERASGQGIPVAVVTNTVGWTLHGLAQTYPHIKVFQVQPLMGVSGISQLRDACTEALQWLSTFDYRIEQRRQTLPVRRLTKQAQMPTRAYSDDAGLDLYTSETVVIRPGQFADVPTGVAVEMESHHWAMLTGRSSTLRSRGLLVQTGIIDPGYRGELYAGVFNVGRAIAKIDPGERIAQLIVLGNQTQTLEPVEVQRLREHPRGSKGFGSSGV